MVRKVSVFEHWATPFKIHTPPVEDFILHWECEFSNALPSVGFFNKVYHRGSKYFIEMPNELIYLELTLPLKEMFLKSSTGGVWNSNGVSSPFCQKQSGKFKSVAISSSFKRLLALFMQASEGILNLPTSSLHLCSPFQQNR